MLSADCGSDVHAQDFMVEVQDLLPAFDPTGLVCLQSFGVVGCWCLRDRSWVHAGAVIRKSLNSSKNFAEGTEWGALRNVGGHAERRCSIDFRITANALASVRSRVAGDAEPG